MQQQKNNNKKTEKQNILQVLARDDTSMPIKCFSVYK